MQAILPIEIFKILEDKIGREEAEKVSSAIELSLETIETKAKETALQKKLELKDELTKELATKADLNFLRAEQKADLQLVKTELNAKIDNLETRLSAQSKLYFVILLCAIIITNPKSIELIAKILGIVK
jgi:hypothetical protein